MKTLLYAAIGALLGALIAYLAAVWMTGYFYSPMLVEAGNPFGGAMGTRYSMLVCFAVGLIVGGTTSAK